MTALVPTVVDEPIAASIAMSEGNKPGLNAAERAIAYRIWDKLRSLAPSPPPSEKGEDSSAVGTAPFDHNKR